MVAAETVRRSAADGTGSRWSSVRTRDNSVPDMLRRALDGASSVKSTYEYWAATVGSCWTLNWRILYRKMENLAKRSKTFGATRTNPNTIIYGTFYSYLVHSFHEKAG